MIRQTRRVLTLIGLVVAGGVSSASAAQARGRHGHTLRWAQEVLARHQYYIREVDDRPGAYTRSAGRQLQIDHRHRGLKPTGHLDARTLEVLEELAGKGSPE